MKGPRQITLAEYAALADKTSYDLLLKSIKGNGKGIQVRYTKDFIRINPKHEDIWDFSYSDIIELKKALAEKKDMELLAELFRIVYQVKDITCVNVLDVFTVPGWIVKAMQELMEVEQSELAYEPDEKEKAAGIEELARFEEFPTIDALAGGDLSKHAEVLSWPYHKVFQKLCYQKETGEIQKRLIHAG